MAGLWRVWVCGGGPRVATAGIICVRFAMGVLGAATLGSVAWFEALW